MLLDTFDLALDFVLLQWTVDIAKQLQARGSAMRNAENDEVIALAMQPLIRGYQTQPNPQGKVFRRATSWHHLQK